MGVEIKGLEGVLERLDGIAGDNMPAQIEKACLLVERTAKQTAPKVDGALRRSITSKVEGYSGTVFSNLFYAPYVEYGTGLFSTHEMGGRKDVPWVYYDEKKNEYITTYGQYPQPYMRPALDTNREQIIELLREGLKP